jgi:ATP-dependent DNA helicase RecQ
METMINYVSSTNHCRSRLLLDYFGEENTMDCGFCDICLNKNNSNSVKDKILSLLKDKGPQTLNSIITSINDEPNKTIDAIRLLIDNKEIISTDNITFKIR